MKRRAKIYLSKRKSKEGKNVNDEDTLEEKEERLEEEHIDHGDWRLGKVRDAEERLHDFTKEKKILVT